MLLFLKITQAPLKQQSPAFQGLPAWSCSPHLSCVSSLPGGEVVTMRMIANNLSYFVYSVNEKLRKNRNKL